MQYGRVPEAAKAEGRKFATKAGSRSYKYFTSASVCIKTKNCDKIPCIFALNHEIASVAAICSVLQHRYFYIYIYIQDTPLFTVVEEGKARCDLKGAIHGPCKSLKEPDSLGFIGSSKAGNEIILSADLGAASLPRQALTVEAWVMIDRPQKWGGICGAIQDNGSYEKGWLLKIRHEKPIELEALMSHGEYTDFLGSLDQEDDTENGDDQ